MLKLTPHAAASLTAARADSGAPDTFGVRFFASTAPAGTEPRLGMEFVALPEPNDATLQEHGLRTYVAPEVTQLIGDGVVDVESVDGQAQLVLRHQADAET